MPTLLDDAVLLKKETTFGTAVTPDRAYPMLDDTKGEWDPRTFTGAGVRGGAGRRSPLVARTYTRQGQGVVVVRTELDTRQGGVLLEAGLGVLTVTSITGGTQMLGHPGITGTYLPSYTIQLQKTLNPGTQRVETYYGCTPTKCTFEQPDEGPICIETEFDAMYRTTLTAAATPSYTLGVLVGAEHTVSSVGTSGLVVPTTTALASGLTASAEFKTWKVEIDHSAETGDWRSSARARPVIGTPQIKWSASVGHDSDAWPDYCTAGSTVSWYATATSAQSVGAGRYAGLQVVVPAMVVEKAPTKGGVGSLRTVDASARVLSDGTNQDLYVAYTSLDTAA